MSPDRFCLEFNCLQVYYFRFTGQRTMPKDQQIAAVINSLRQMSQNFRSGCRPFNLTANNLPEKL
jgi:hypothetical protein